MVSYTEFLETYYDYLAYLNDGGERVVIPPRRRKNRPQPFVSASNLGRCPYSAAMKHRQEPETHPLTYKEKGSALHLMQQGVRDAEPFQEAFSWKYGKLALAAGTDPERRWLNMKPTSVSGSIAELPVEDPVLRVSGRIDAIVCVDSELHIVEVKRRDAITGQDMPRPKITDAMQTIAYSLITGIKQATIIMINRYYFNAWTLLPIRDGFMLVNEEGAPWENPLNTPDYLNYETVEKEIALHLAYLDKQVTGTPEHLKDFLNATEGWQCFKWQGDKPKKYKNVYKGQTERTEMISRRCAYFCHGGNVFDMEVRETAYDSKNYELILEGTNDGSTAETDSKDRVD